MLKLLFKILAILWLGMLPVLLHAQNRSYYFEHYTVADGLSHNNINGLFTDSKGFLWIATRNGLNSFDGYEFVKYYHNPADSNSLPNSNIYSVTEDKQGLIWVGMWGGVATFDRRTGRFTTRHLDFERGFDKVQHIFCDSRNRIWIATSMGPYVFDTKGNLLGHWRTGTGLPQDQSNSTYEDKTGNIWVSGGGGLYLYNETEKGFKVYTNTHPVYTKNNNWVDDAMYVGAEHGGCLWFGGWGNGLKQFNINDGTTHSYLVTPELAGHGAFNVVPATALFNNQIWVSCNEGVGTFDTATHQFSFLKNLQLEGYELPTTSTKGMHVHGNILWVATEAGLYKLDLARQIFDIHKLLGLKWEESCLTNLSDISPVPGKPDSLLLPAWTCGIFTYNINTRKAELLKDKVIADFHDHIRLDVKRIIYDRQGNRWVASSHGMFVTHNEKTTVITPVPVEKGKLPRENYMVTVKEDANGNIWAGTLDGILYFERGSLNYKKYTLADIGITDSAYSDYIEDLATAPNGDVWVLRTEARQGANISFTVYRSKEDKFYTYLAGEGSFKNYPFAVTGTSILADSHGQVWVTSERGLMCFSAEKMDTFTLLTSADGLISDDCGMVINDSKGNIWVSGFGGLSLIDPVSKKMRNFTSADGLPPAGLSSVSAGENGQLYIGFNHEWMAIYDPLPLSTALDADTVTVIDVIYDDKHVQDVTSFEVPYNFSYLRLRYSAFNFLAAKDNVYRISITTGDKTVEYTTSSNEITLSSLEPGTHDISIELMSLYTPVSVPAKFKLIVRPAFWQTWWFRTGIVLLFLLVVAIVVNARIKRIRAEEEKRRELNIKLAAAEMNALRSQMNPHFIFNALNAVHSFIWKKQPVEASEYLTKFSRLTRLVLENSRSHWVKLAEDLSVLDYFLQLEALNVENGLEFTISVDPAIDPEIMQIPPMLMQPFVENSLKHGLKNLDSTGHISIEVKLEGEEICCIIDDDGVGRTGRPSINGHTSLGTTITTDRIEVINELYKTNARFVFEDKTDDTGKATGTRVYLFLPYIDQ